jgi:Fe-S cluster assembly protein SufB
MAKVQEERVEVGALRSDYQFGFRDPDQSVFRARKGLDHGIVAQLSEIKGEPSWMRDIRLKALDIFLQKPLPRWGGYLDDLDFDDIYYYVKPSDRAGRTWEDVPENIKKTLIV